MDEKTYNKDFVLYSLGMNIEELEKYLDPSAAIDSRFLKLLKTRGFATIKDDDHIRMNNFCTYESLQTGEPEIDPKKMAVVEVAFHKWYPKIGEIKVEFTYRNNDECAIWRSDMFSGDEINRKLRAYFSK